MCFYSTDNNSAGIRTGVLEQKLNKDILCLACIHHKDQKQCLLQDSKILTNQLKFCKLLK